jgi:hypothetical protein
MPPAGWAIVDHQVVVHSSNNGTREVSTIAGGSNFISEVDLHQAYDQLEHIAGEYSEGDPSQASKFSADLSKKYSAQLKEVRKFSASNNTLQAIVRAWVHGHRYIDEQRGWEEIDVVARLRCVGVPSPEVLAQQIAKQIGMQNPSTIVIENRCKDPLAIALNYERLDGKRETLGWFTVEPGFFLPVVEGKERLTNSGLLFLYAQTKDGGLKLEGVSPQPVNSPKVKLVENYIKIRHGIGQVKTTETNKLIVRLYCKDRKLKVCHYVPSDAFGGMVLAEDPDQCNGI